MFETDKPKGLKPITPIPFKKERPAYSMAAIKKIRDHLDDIIGFKYLESPFTSDMLLEYIEDLCFYMKWSESHIDNIYQSLYPYTKKYEVFTKKVCAKIARRVAGAYLNLHAGEVLPLEDSTVLNSWLGVEVVYSQLSRKSFNRQLMLIKFNVTAGSIAGSIYSQEFPVSTLYKVFKESLKLGKYTSLTPPDLFGMHFLGYLAMTDREEVQFINIATNSYQDTFNRKLRSARNDDCIHNTPFQCIDCPVGSDRCNNATHLSTYEVAKCKNSAREPHEAYVDATRRDGYCLQCAKLQATGYMFYKKSPQNNQEA